MGFFGTVAAILVALAIRDWFLKPAKVEHLPAKQFRNSSGGTRK